MRETRQLMSLRYGRAALAAACLLAGLSLPAWADALNWRQTSVLTTQEGKVAVRKGVAIFGNGEPATLTVRLQPLGPPSGRSVTIGNDMVFRFEDGSTLTLKGETIAQIAPEGGTVRGESTTIGKVVAGTGRFNGATGDYKMRVRTDIDRTVDGAMGDYFAVCEASYSLAK